MLETLQGQIMFILYKGVVKNTELFSKCILNFIYKLIFKKCSPLLPLYIEKSMILYVLQNVQRSFNIHI